MLSLAVSPARTFQPPGNKPASRKAPALACSMNLCESFAWWDRATSSWRTSQRSLLTDWTLYSERWPKQGLMLSGHVYRQQMWAPAIGVIGGGVLPTPATQEWKRRGPNSSQQGLSNTENWMLPTPNAGLFNDSEDPQSWLERRERVKLTANNGNGMGMPLAVAVKLLPTPPTNDSKNASLPPSQAERDGLAGAMLRNDSIPTGAATYLNPSFVEEMMGFPVGWTVSEP
jgi:hypothetical protein